ncbi:MAG: GNAT family N-acetyltransferase [Muribaculaceae bacterium]|nr:GNAT family N-acetyltransferase [Muribaculaceae bacterium]
MLSDDTLILRALEPDDLDVLYRWENDTSLWSVGTTIAPFSRKQLWDYIATYDNDLYSARQLRLMIVDRRLGEALGTIDLCDFDPANRRMSVGILIDPAHARRGIATRALRIIIEYSRSVLGLHQLYAYVPADNRPSLSLFGKCGFRSAGCLRSWLRRGNTYADVIILQKLFADS